MSWLTTRIWAPLFERDRKGSTQHDELAECVRTPTGSNTGPAPFTRWITPEIETDVLMHFFTTELPLNKSLFMTKRRRPVVNGFLRRQPSIYMKPSRLSPPLPARSA